MRAAFVALTAAAAVCASAAPDVSLPLAKAMLTPGKLGWSADGHMITAAVATAVRCRPPTGGVSPRAGPHCRGIRAHGGFGTVVRAGSRGNGPLRPPAACPRSDPVCWVRCPQFLKSNVATELASILTPDTVESCSTWADSVKDEKGWEWSKVRPMRGVCPVHSLPPACSTRARPRPRSPSTSSTLPRGRASSSYVPRPVRGLERPVARPGFAGPVPIVPSSPPCPHSRATARTTCACTVPS